MQKGERAITDYFKYMKVIGVNTIKNEQELNARLV